MDDMFIKPKKKVRLQSGRTLHAAPTPLKDDLVEPVFVPPEQVAKNEQPAKPATATRTPKPPKKASWWKRQSKKKKLLVAIPASIILLSGIGVTAYFLTKKDPVIVPPAPEPVVEKIVEPPKPTTIASELTGVQVDPILNARGVTAVMIENSMDARPQSGLLEAGIIHEAIAEGGITRFVALFQEAQPAYIGPVRSARPYYIDWILPYSPAYAHAGGSSEALQMIANLGMKDMEHGVNGSAYQRVSNRYAPHNLYTTMANLDGIRTKRGWDNPDFIGLARKADAPSKTPNATAIDLKISSTLYNVHYDYDLATNSYNRSEGGKPHIDEKSSKQLAPKVVIAMIVPYSIHPDGVHSKYQTLGTGQAYIFQDGIVQEASWTKSSQSAQLDFKDTGGRNLSFNSGQTWITTVGQASMVSFTGPPAPTTGATP